LPIANLSDWRTVEETTPEAKPAASQGDVPLSDAHVSASSQAPDGLTTSDKQVESSDSKELEEYLAVRENLYKAAKEIKD